MSTSFTDLNGKHVIRHEFAVSTVADRYLGEIHQPCRLIDANVVTPTTWTTGTFEVRKRKSGSVEAPTAAPSATLLAVTGSVNMNTIVAQTRTDLAPVTSRDTRTFMPGDEVVVAFTVAPSGATVGGNLTLVFELL